MQTISDKLAINNNKILFGYSSGSLISIFGEGDIS